MPKFCANLGRLFTEHPLMERFAAAKEAGFDAVELLMPYDSPAQDMRDQMIWNKLAFVAMNCPPPNATGGPQGFAAVPGLEDRFRRDFDRTMRFAKVLKPQQVHILPGKAAGADARQTFVDNLRWAARRAPDQGLTIGPDGLEAQHGEFLTGIDEAATIITEIGEGNLRLLFDAEAAGAATGDVLSVWASYGHLATHVRVAGHPAGRGPSAGSIDWPAFLGRLDRDGYAGWVAAAYDPTGPTGRGLGWLKASGAT